MKIFISRLSPFVAVACAAVVVWVALILTPTAPQGDFFSLPAFALFFALLGVTLAILGLHRAPARSGSTR